MKLDSSRKALKSHMWAHTVKLCVETNKNDIKNYTNANIYILIHQKTQKTRVDTT